MLRWRSFTAEWNVNRFIIHIGVKNVKTRQSIVLLFFKTLKDARNAKAHSLVLEVIKFTQNKDTGDRIT